MRVSDDDGAKSEDQYIPSVQFNNWFIDLLILSKKSNVSCHLRIDSFFFKSQLIQIIKLNEMVLWLKVISSYWLLPQFVFCGKLANRKINPRQKIAEKEFFYNTENLRQFLKNKFYPLAIVASKGSSKTILPSGCL